MKRLITLIIMSFPLLGFSQFGVGYFQSSIPYIGFNYEIKGKFKPEIRLGTDLFLDHISLEMDFTYDFINKYEYELYGGLGYIVGDFQGLVIPVGLNIYPFESKAFGFMIELSPIVFDASILRGSMGIRYRFFREL